jgi:branched-chain amino acid aminotransferase
VKRLAVVDGVTTALEDAKVSVQDRGFLYGDSVFETLRTYDGAPFALGRHLGRLEWSAGLTGIALPLSLADFAAEITEAIRAAGNAESYVRVMVTRGRGELGLDPGLAIAPTRVIIVTPLAPPSPETYARGISVVSFRVRRAADGTDVAGAKIGNYLVSVLAMKKAHAAGAAEALIVDAAGAVVEGATSNVFFVRRGTLVTPPDDAGILPGITRAVALDVAREAGVPVSFEAPSLDSLPGFDEVFISSSIRELLAVVRVDETTVGDGTPGPVYRRLHDAFRRAVRSVPRVH